MKPAVERHRVPIRELRKLLTEARKKLGAEGCRKLKAAVDTLAYATTLIEDQHTTISVQGYMASYARPSSHGPSTDGGKG